MRVTFTRVVLFLALLFAVGRVFITPRLVNIPTFEGTYEALVHLFDGFLIIVIFYDPKEKLGPSKLYGWIGWALAFWELGWFIVQKMHHG
jgi:hypothetical protein